LGEAQLVECRCFEEFLGPARYLSLCFGDSLREGLGGFRYRFALVCFGPELLDDGWREVGFDCGLECSLRKVCLRLG
jgi:hypothetical protein